MASSAPYVSASDQARRAAQAPLNMLADRQAADAAASAQGLLRQREQRANQSLQAMQQTVGPDGQTNTIYGRPSASASSASRASASSGGASDGISEDEIRRIKLITGAGKQEPVVRNTVDETAAREAAFARAKEKSGQIAQSSLAGLRNSLSRRGITGGGYAQLKGAEALAPATDQLQDFTREQAIQEANQASRNADTDYAGGITQRGQDQGSVNALLSLINSRGRLY